MAVYFGLIHELSLARRRETIDTIVVTIAARVQLKTPDLNSDKKDSLHFYFPRALKRRLVR